MKRLNPNFEIGKSSIRWGEISRTVDPTVVGPVIPPGTSITTTNTYAIIESTRLSSTFSAKRRYVVAASDPNFEPIIRQETLNQGWKDHWASASGQATPGAFPFPQDAPSDPLAEHRAEGRVY